MAKAPTKRGAPAKRAVRVLRNPDPQNPSRAAGAPAPASAAATAPRAGQFYDPTSSMAQGSAEFAQQTRNPLADAAARVAHNAGVADRAVQDADLPHASLDAEIVDQVADGYGRDHAAPPAGESYEDKIARIRTLRRPLGAFSQKLALPDRAGYKRHWFNDEGGRIDDALANGWAQILDKDKRPLRRAVGRGRDQGVLYAYAMELPLVFWQEDMAARHATAAEKIAALKTSPGRAPQGGANKSDQGKFYSPVEDTGREFLEVQKG